LCLIELHLLWPDMIRPRLENWYEVDLLAATPDV